jgi:predicted small lipoprotein YifL
MKKLFLSLCLTAVVLTVTACGSSSAVVSKGPDNTPEWLNDFPPEDVIWGIGTAKQSSPSMSMTTAEARAKTAIARQLSTKVQAMFTDYNLDAGNVKNQANSSLQEDVSRQITNMDVSGARPIKRWQAPDGTWWYLVELKKSDAKKTVASILGNEEAAYAQFKTKQALDMLDAQLAKSEKPVQVDN